ncbi:MAG: hypothetical protein IJ006_01720 [Lachnospiraceae bacterium]|nr:hypothetical protein [Lachnospiraceae bacterium]MBQ8845839.1 hypothetical protein [Lachnospiraceae bacterium]
MRWTYPLESGTVVPEKASVFAVLAFVSGTTAVAFVMEVSAFAPELEWTVARLPVADSVR